MTDGFLEIILEFSSKANKHSPTAGAGWQSKSPVVADRAFKDN